MSFASYSKEDSNRPSSDANNNNNPNDFDAKLSTNVYVRGLPLHWTVREFNLFFSRYGPIVSSRILYAPNSKKSRGMGFIRFQNHSDATIAVAKVDGHVPDELGGTKPLYCKFAKDPQTMGGREAGDNKYHPYQAKVNADQVPEGRDPLNLYIVDVPLNLTKEGLMGIYGQYGQLQSCTVLSDPTTGISRGIGLARFLKAESAAQAMKETQGLLLPGATKPLLVRYARVTEKKTDEEKKAFNAANNLLGRKVAADWEVQSAWACGPAAHFAYHDPQRFGIQPPPPVPQLNTNNSPTAPNYIEQWKAYFSQFPGMQPPLNPAMPLASPMAPMMTILPPVLPALPSLPQMNFVSPANPTDHAA
jgi:RNA recognition motif-containing protein